MPHQALTVIGRWAADASTITRGIAANASEIRPDFTQEIAERSRVVLHLMCQDIVAGIPTHVLALTSGGEIEDIEAMAFVTVSEVRDEATGAGRTSVRIKGLVANPAAREKQGRVAELISRIQEGAKGQAVSISLMRALEDYYVSLGFTPEGTGKLDMLRGRHGLEGASGEGGLSVTALALANDFLPVPTPLMAITVIDRWAADAARAEARAQVGGDDQAHRLMQETQGALASVRGSVVRGVPVYVFALAVGERVEDIQALATVTTQLVASSVGGGMREVVEIRELLEKPPASGWSGVAELVRRIHVWAGDRSVIVSATRELKGYYAALGYELKDLASSSLVRSEKGPRGPPAGRMLALEPETNFTLEHVPLRASAVVGQWSEDAAAGLSSSVASSDDARQRVLQGTQRMLKQVNRTISEGAAGYMFALATGARVEDILAIATVAVRADAGKGETVEIRELVAAPAAADRDHGGSAELIHRIRPTSRGHQLVTGLIRRVHVWAEGRRVTISRAGELADGYYRGLGFEPEDMVLPRLAYSEYEFEGPPLSERFRMVALDAAAGPEPGLAAASEPVQAVLGEDAGPAAPAAAGAPDASTDRPGSADRATSLADERGAQYVELAARTKLGRCRQVRKTLEGVNLAVPYHMVKDVETYAEWMPLCTGGVTTGRGPDGEITKCKVAFGIQTGLLGTLGDDTSYNMTLTPPRQIGRNQAQACAVADTGAAGFAYGGRLVYDWVFTMTETSPGNYDTQVALSVFIQLKSRPYLVVWDAIEQALTTKMLKAFEKRAASLGTVPKFDLLAPPSGDIGS